MNEVQSRILCFETVDILKRYHVQFCGGDTIDDRKNQNCNPYLDRVYYNFTHTFLSMNKVYWCSNNFIEDNTKVRK